MALANLESSFEDDLPVEPQAAPSTGSLPSDYSLFHSAENGWSTTHTRPFGGNSLESVAETAIMPTDEFRLSVARQQKDPPSYYHFAELNQGPVDNVPRLVNVSSEYALTDLRDFSPLDTPENAYKMKSMEHEFDHLDCHTAHEISRTNIHYDNGEVYYCL